MRSAPRTPYERHTAGQPPERPVKTDKGSPKPTRLLAPNPRNPHAKRAPGPPRPRQSYKPHATKRMRHRVGAPNTNGKRKKGSPNLSAQNPKEKQREPGEKIRPTHKNTHLTTPAQPLEKRGTPRKTHTAQKMKPERKRAELRDNPKRTQREAAAPPHKNTHLTHARAQERYPSKSLQAAPLQAISLARGMLFRKSGYAGARRDPLTRLRRHSREGLANKRAWCCGRSVSPLVLPLRTGIS